MKGNIIRLDKSTIVKTSLQGNDEIAYWQIKLLKSAFEHWK